MSKDDVHEKGGGERYPTLRQKPSVRSTPGFKGEPWFNAEVRRTNGNRGWGNGGTPEKATDDAYTKAGGKVNTDRKYNF
jgi:hypothetical protein